MLARRKDRSEWLLGLEQISSLRGGSLQGGGQYERAGRSETPGGAVKLAEAEDLSVARALCAESGAESAKAQTGGRGSCVS